MALNQEYSLRFPPFPNPPPGVTIVSFSHFKERGIKVNNHDFEIEVDALGIPTVELQSKHKTDKCKTNAKRKYKKIKKHGSAAKNPKEWWASWVDTQETSDSCTYNINETDVSRFYQAAADFRKTRTWPAQETGIATLWDQFRLFVGLLNNTPACRKRDAGRPHPELCEDDEDDEFSSDEEQDVPPSTKPKSDVENAGTPMEVEDVKAIQELLDDGDTQREEKMDQFFKDPEKSMKIFLSSHMRDQGLIWSPRNLENVPRIVSFFLNFIIRHRALPEYEPGLRRAATIVELGLRELPLTGKIGQALPGDFSKACEALWGRRSRGFVFPADVESDKKDEDQPAAGNWDHRDAKRQKTDEIIQSETEPKAANIQAVYTCDTHMGTEVVEDKAGDDSKSKTDGDWGAGDWAAGTWDNSAMGNLGTASDEWVTQDVSGWEDPSPTLLAIMGPTTLPITHAPGVAEWSMRRIKAVIPASPNQHKTFEAPDGPNAEAVEEELEKRFARMVMEPWLDWDPSDKQDISKPQILPKSRGAAIASLEAPKEGNANGSSEGNVHNVMTDDIIVLVPASTVDILGIGMGLAATWVQITRQDQTEEMPAATPEKNRKEGEKNVNTYWYMEQLMAILPSYHTG